MTTSRSHVKQRFSPYRSTPSAPIPDDLAATFSRQCSIAAKPKKSGKLPSSPSSSSSSSETRTIIKHKKDFWSRLPDDEFSSICQQACSPDPSADEVRESLTHRRSLRQPTDEIIESFAQKCSILTPMSVVAQQVPSPASSREKNKHPFSSSKWYPQLRGFSQEAIVHQCLGEVLTHRMDLSFLDAPTQRSGLEETKQMLERYVGYCSVASKLSDWSRKYSILYDDACIQLYGDKYWLYKLFNETI